MKIQVRVDPKQGRKPISPLIYGVNFADSAALRALNIPLNRSGGNSATRYNWKLNARSAAADWFFASVPESEGGSAPSGAIDAFVGRNRTARVKSMVTIPLIGWAAKLGPKREQLGSFSVKKYGAQQKTEQWHPDFGNGTRPDGKPITGNNPNDANMPVDLNFERGHLQHLVKTFGTASRGGVSYYLLDNEAGLWHSTHRDVFPTGFKMDDYFKRARSTAAMIKEVDPSALIGGPEEWGWIGYLYSGFDSQWASVNGYSKPRPDRTAHGNLDFSAWLLQQFAKEEKRSGKRLLDIFTLHYYPQASNVDKDDVSPATQQLRMRSTRSLWDASYKDESWINEKIQLIPRMKQWVKSCYPGTKLGITEYNFGAEAHISGGIAQADVLGILGREGVDLATRWTCPKPNTPTARAFQLYRNYDGKGGSFGDTSVRCESSASPDIFGAYAAQDSKSGQTTVVLINKQLTGDVTVELSMVGKSKLSLRGYRLAGNDPIKPLPRTTSATITLPAQTATLLVL